MKLQAKFQRLLQMETLGVDSLGSFMKGVGLTAPLATTSVTDFFEAIDDLVLLESLSLNDLFKEVGENAASSFVDGFNGFQLKELMPSSGNLVPFDTSRIDSSWKSNLPKINTTTQSFPSVPLSESVMKDFQAAMREKIELDVKLSVEPNEREFVNVAISGINQRTKATGKTPIALQY